MKRENHGGDIHATLGEHVVVVLVFLDRLSSAHPLTCTRRWRRLRCRPRQGRRGWFASKHQGFGVLASQSPLLPRHTEHQQQTDVRTKTLSEF